MSIEIEVPELEELTALLEFLYSDTDGPAEDGEVGDFIARQVLDKDAQFFEG
jgi:hypothetical protein